MDTTAVFAKVAAKRQKQKERFRSARENGPKQRDHISLGVLRTALGFGAIGAHDRVQKHPRVRILQALLLKPLELVVEIILRAEHGRDGEAAGGGEGVHRDGARGVAGAGREDGVAGRRAAGRAKHARGVSTNGGATICSASSRLGQCLDAPGLGAAYPTLKIAGIKYPPHRFPGAGYP